jgi:mannose-6-phosphate isomerase-like protein (cupin superfamily)
VATSGLAVAEEEMPPGTSEHRHVHAHARQFFYVLDGELAMELPEGSLVIRARQGLEVAPGTPHRAFNASASPVRFLVVSSPTTAGDRTNLE